MTVLLPVLNGERWIADSLESLRAQTFQDFEILLIDDGCTDRTISIALGLRLPSLRIIQGPRQGVGAALALGVMSSLSPLLARQDSDDLSNPRRLEKQVNYMAEHPNCVMVGSWAQTIDENGLVLGTIKQPKMSRNIKFAMNLNSPFVHTSVLLRKEAVIRAGNYRMSPIRILAEDYDLWSRMAHLGDFHNIQAELVSYRINLDGVTGTHGQALSRSGCEIALRTIDKNLGVRLSDADRQLFSLYFIRHRRISVVDAVRLYLILLRLVVKSGFPPPTQAITWRRWLAPLAWIVRSPKHAVSVRVNDEIL